MRRPLLRDVEFALAGNTAGFDASAIDLAVDALREMNEIPVVRPGSDPDQEGRDDTSRVQESMTVFEDPEIVERLSRLRSLAALVAALPRRTGAGEAPRLHLSLRRQTSISMTDGMRVVEDGRDEASPALDGDRIGADDLFLMLPVVSDSSAAVRERRWGALTAGSIVGAGELVDELDRIEP